MPTIRHGAATIDCDYLVVLVTEKQTASRIAGIGTDSQLTDFLLKGIPGGIIICNEAEMACFGVK